MALKVDVRVSDSAGANILRVEFAARDPNLVLGTLYMSRDIWAVVRNALVCANRWMSGDVEFLFSGSLADLTGVR